MNEPMFCDTGVGTHSHVQLPISHSHGNQHTQDSLNSSNDTVFTDIEPYAVLEVERS